MIPTLGLLAALLGLALALLQGTLPLAGAMRGRADWMALARPLALLQFLCVAAAFGCLAASFVQHDFSVLYVALHSNTALPLAYRIAAVWGGHEGSLLLWLLMLNLWSVAVAHCSRSLPLDFVARVLAVMGLLAAGFLLFMLLASNPFERLLPAALEGRDLNPLLQDAGMVLHPPMLYMGYVGFSVAFAFAVAALLQGRLDATWARWTRPWTLAAWCFLTAGIALGSWWAYTELGWGGWWFWDPVENASLMPWLAGTALIHSLAVAEKRGSFKAWTVLLAIVAFALSLLGTFLVRSGVLSSVHAFAIDPRRGLFILGLLAIAIGAALLLYAWRAPKLGLGQRFGIVSRESLLLANNMLLAAATGAVALGTLYPLALDALGLGRISVGAPYFDSVFAALMAPLVLLLGIGPLARWKHDEMPDLWRRLRAPLALVALALLALVAFDGDGASPASIAGLAMGLWIAASIAADLRERLRQAGSNATRLAQRLRQLPRSVVAMMLAHLGVAVFIVGVTMVKTHESARDVELGPGEAAELAGHAFRLVGLREVQGANYRGVQAMIEVTRAGRPVAMLAPEKRVYRMQRSPMTEAAIDSGALRDLYVSLGEPVGHRGRWIVRLQHKPFVGWIWGGCLLMALGGALAAADRRYRRQREAFATALASPAVAWQEGSRAG